MIHRLRGLTQRLSVHRRPQAKRRSRQGLTPRMLRLTTRQLGLLSIMVVLNADTVMGVALNASVGLMPTVTAMLATTWEILIGHPKASALTTAMGTEDLICSEQSVGLLTCLH